MNKKLSILITCRERRVTLPRILQYYSSYADKYDFYILDSSRREYDGNVDRSKFKYIFDPLKEINLFFYEILKGIKTQYSVIIPDDDFLLMDNIEFFLNFLDEYKSVKSVCGQLGGLYDKESIATKENIITYDTLEYYFHLNHNYMGNDVEERIEHCWKYFEARNHDVYRTEVLSNIYEVISFYESLQPVRFVDKVLSFLSLVQGNVAVIPDFYCIRSAEKFLSPFQGRYIVNAPGMDKELRTDLHFEKHFLDFENDKILSEITNLSCEKIRTLYYEFIDNDKESEYKKYAKHYDKIVNYKIQDYLIVPSFRFHGFLNCDSEEEMAESCARNYPIFYSHNFKNIEKILDTIRSNPIDENWYHQLKWS